MKMLYMNRIKDGNKLYLDYMFFSKEPNYLEA